MLSTVLAILLTLTGFLLMFVILLQRGRGGGLAGALGGMGGQSAFGTKAGDVFTKITIGMAVVWVVLSGVTGMAMFSDSNSLYRHDGADSPPGVSAGEEAGEVEGTAPLLPEGIGLEDLDLDKKDPDKQSPDANDESPESDPPE